MDDQEGDKTHDPTAHRRQEARQHGQVAQSQDLSGSVLLLGLLVSLLVFGPPLAALLAGLTQHQLASFSLELPPAAVVRLARGVLVELAGVVLPILGAAFLLAVLAALSQVGFLWLPEKLAPDPSRIDPLKGLKRIFSANNAVRLLFGVLKLTLVTGVAYVCLAGQAEAILALVGLEPPQLARYLSETALWTAIKIAAALLALAAADYFWQWWRLEQELRMTTQEMREEMKTLQGDPQVIARRRMVQRQLALHRLSSAVPKADVVVTNPTELAVAISYEAQTMAAPVVVAKGAGVVAQQIRKLALEHGVPIVENKPLAQSLYKDVDLGKPIPDKLYAAVAEVLAYVYQLENKRMPGDPAS
jgi:flagellar biosynthetic protein FlhB